jgi:phosphate transport system protein
MREPEAPPAPAPIIDDAVRQQVIHLFALVGESMVSATHALLSNDRELAKSVVQGDIEIDAFVTDLLRFVERSLVAEEAPPSSEREDLLRLIRILPEIERNGDLAEHVARRAARGLGVEMSPRSRGLVERMGEVCATIWREATDAIVDGDETAVTTIEEIDDELDDLHVPLTAELTSGSMAVPVAVEVAMIARFYERFGDHAVILARRMAALVGGGPEPGTSGPD